MARAELIQPIYVQLTLNEKEAKWIKTTMQNPLHDVPPDKEDPEIRMMRNSIFSVLRNII
jgi:hypothetical protein